MNDLVLLQTETLVTTVTINRPQQLNALNAEVLQALIGVFTAIDPQQTRVVIVTGSGEKSFCAGADIKAMQAMTFAQASAFAALGHRCMDLIAACPVPVIAAVNGFCFGGGAELMLACDFAYAVDTAKLGLPEVTLGLFPGFGGTQRLATRVGYARAVELIATGGRVAAADALAMGLVNKVLPAADLAATVQKLAATIAVNAPIAVQTAKRCIAHGLEVGQRDALAYEQANFASCFTTTDSTEGLTAFVEGRKPNYTGA